MKKAMVLIVALLVMALGLTAVSSAAPGVFVSSPSGNPAPELVSGDAEADDCVAKLEITPYSERDQLPAFLREQIEAAYGEIVNAEDVGDLTAAVEQLAQQLGIPVEDLAVSDLFDIHYYNCDDHDRHGHFDIVLKSDLLKNFVCLLHRQNGQWHIVEGAKVTNNGEHLDFDASDLSPFAIVVNTGDGVKDPSTGDAFNIALYVALALVSAAAVVYLCVKLRKQKAN